MWIATASIVAIHPKGIWQVGNLRLKVVELFLPDRGQAVHVTDERADREHAHLGERGAEARKLVLALAALRIGQKTIITACVIAGYVGEAKVVIDENVGNRVFKASVRNDGLPSSIERTRDRGQSTPTARGENLHLKNSQRLAQSSDHALLP